MTADVIQLKEWVVCSDCRWFMSKSGPKEFDRCQHPDNIEKKEGFNYKTGPYTLTHNKKHPAALNSNGKCKWWDEGWLDKVLD